MPQYFHVGWRWLNTAIRCTLRFRFDLLRQNPIMLSLLLLHLVAPGQAGASSAKELFLHPCVVPKLPWGLAIFGSPLEHLVHQLQEQLLVRAFQICLKLRERHWRKRLYSSVPFVFEVNPMKSALTSRHCKVLGHGWPGDLRGTTHPTQRKTWTSVCLD